jgi:hypothetical protein
VASAPTQASQASAGRSVCGSFSWRTSSGAVTTAPTARPAAQRGTDRLRSVVQPAVPRRASITGFQIASGTQLREIAAAQVSVTSSVSG